jgi:CoA:oxalate CoA-transferase
MSQSKDSLSGSNIGNDPLSGVRVLDFSSMMAGPYCSRVLADLGAQVIKVESLDGDHIRTQPPLRGGCSAYFGHLNSGKQSIALDLKHPESVALVHTLAKSVDIVLENFRPGVMSRLGMDYARLAAGNPRLIYCSISGYGQTGPDAQRAAYAPIINAASGHDLAQMLYQDERDRPPNVGIFTADLLTGVYAVTAIQAALLQRQRTNRGQHLDVTLIESMMNLMVYEFQEAQFPAAQRRFVYKPVKARDGFVMIVLVSPANFANLCNAIGRPEWKDNPRFATVKARRENWDELMSLVEAWSQQRSAKECEEFLNKAGVPCTRYRTVKDAMADPHLHDRGSFQRVSDAAGGYLVPNLPYRMDQGGARARAHVPSLGEHTAEVLRNELGLDDAEIAKLRQAKAVG